MTRSISIALLTFGVSIAAAATASAQTATEAQKEALRSSCVSGFLSHCKGVPRGGVEAVQCLAKNYASLSTSCQAAVKAVDPKVE